MFQLPSFFKIRLVVLVIGFFMLFWLIGFVKWCFAGTYYTYEQKNIRYPDPYCCANGAFPGFTFDNCSGSWTLDKQLGIPFKYYVLQYDFIVTKHVDSQSPVVVRNETLVEYQMMDNWQVTEIGNCKPCVPPTSEYQIQECGSIQNVASIDPDTCALTCKNCWQVEALQEPCPVGFVLDFQCSELGSPPIHLNFPADHPAGRLCVEDPCPASQAAWVAEYCTGPGKTLTSYDCATNIGFCETSCAQKEADWVAANCSGPGQSLTSYDCATNIGFCATDCVQKEAAWVAANCTPGQTAQGFNCSAYTGVCNNDKCQEITDWWTAYCRSQNKSLVSTDCVLNTGVCSAGPDPCIEIEDWWTAYCRSQNKSLESYDCVANTGVCSAGPDPCIEIEDWWTAYCNAQSKSLNSFDCTANTGVCSSTVDPCIEIHDWWTAYCKAQNKSLAFWDCASNTGTCSLGTDPCIEVHDWWSAYCQSNGKTGPVKDFV